MTIEQLTSFFGWLTLLNIGLFALMALIIVSCKAKIAKLHSKMFGLKEAELYSLYFQYMGRYKILILAFNLMPYLALRVIG